MGTRISVVAVAAVLFLASVVLSQEQTLTIKGHELGEPAEQFFSEGHEKEALGACATGNFKSIDKPSRRVLKQYCLQLTGARQQAISGKRTEYKGDGDPTEMRTDTFTFDRDHLVKVALVFAVPSAEENYRGQTFAQIFAGVKQAYGPPTSEHTDQVHDAFGVPHMMHRELWDLPQAVIVITEQPERWPDHGSTELTASTHAEYDRSVTSGVQQNPNPLQ
jgi:hypothetical protein